MEIGSRGRVIVSPEMLPDRLGTFIGTFGGFVDMAGTARGMAGRLRAGSGDGAESAKPVAKSAKPVADVTRQVAERAAGGSSVSERGAGLPVRPGERA